MCLPVWRELKLYLWIEKDAEQYASSLNVPSRLKGIETYLREPASPRSFRTSKCAFPFEGNWNFVLASSASGDHE